MENNEQVPLAQLEEFFDGLSRRLTAQWEQRAQAEDQRTQALDAREEELKHREAAARAAALLKEKELPEEYWYWHSGETGADLVGAEQLRPFLPAWWELTDAELTESLCYLYGWDARIWVRSSSQGTDTIFVIRGEGRVYARVLSELVNKAG